MGLDMYLHATKYFGAWDHSSKVEKDAYDAIVAASGVPGLRCDGAPSVTVKVTVAYWRKANQVHAWFVENVQGGEDECVPHDVDREQLWELLNLCEKVKASKDPTPLPPQEGFFFGSTDIDEYYWHDIDETIEQLKAVLENKALEHWSFEYCSSW